VSVDPLAAAGFTGAAAAYERGRPGYPDAAIDWLASELGVSAGSPVLDLGAGTGKLTRSLAARGLDVVAVEPLDTMRAELSRVVPAARALPGVAEDIPLDDRSVAAVFSGEAFHWFDLEPALSEIRRVLAGGGLAVLWNVPRWEGEWTREVGEAVVRHRDAREHPWQRGKPWTLDERMHDRDSERLAAGVAGRWEPVQTRSFEHEQRTDRAALLDQFASMSFIGALGDEERAAALADIDGVLVEHGLDEVVLRWRCDAHVTRPVP
jgi:SAM-dependent methyltransferase